MPQPRNRGVESPHGGGRRGSNSLALRSGPGSAARLRRRLPRRVPGARRRGRLDRGAAAARPARPPDSRAERPALRRDPSACLRAPRGSQRLSLLRGMDDPADRRLVRGGRARRADRQRARHALSDLEPLALQRPELRHRAAAAGTPRRRRLPRHQALALRELRALVRARVRRRAHRGRRRDLRAGLALRRGLPLPAARNSGAALAPGWRSACWRPTRCRSRRSSRRCAAPPAGATSAPRCA